MHSVGLEPTKVNLIDSRTTYQAPGDAGCVYINVGGQSRLWRANPRIFTVPSTSFHDFLDFNLRFSMQIRPFGGVVKERFKGGGRRLVAPLGRGKQKKEFIAEGILCGVWCVWYLLMDIVSFYVDFICISYVDGTIGISAAHCRTFDFICRNQNQKDSIVESALQRG